MFQKTLRKLFCFLIISFSFFYANAQQQPIPDWIKDIGGNGESKLTGIAVDKFDNVYVAGNFQGTITVDHSGISTPVLITSKGSYDIFIAKYTADGKLIWAKSIGGNGLDQINNLAVDDDGNVIVGASFNSSVIDCDPGIGVNNVNAIGSDDALIVKLDLNGNFLWSRSIGSNGVERGHVVTTDKLGNVIFVGSFSSTVNLAPYTLTSKGGLDGFIVKYDKNGTVLWAYAIGATGDDEIKSVKTNSNNEIALMGYYSGSIDLNPKGSAYPFTLGLNTYFVAKYAPDGSIIWANKIDGNTANQPSSIAVGPTDDIFITGVYSGLINFNSPNNTISLPATGVKDLFITKYNSSGTTIWARDIAGTANNTYSYYITADVDNNAYIGGFFDRTLIFYDGASSKTLTYSGSGRNTFFGKYNGNGDYIWAFNFGSACDGNFGHKIAVDSKKNVLLGGAFCNTVDFNPAICTLNLTAKHSTSDGYISKYNQIKFTGDPIITLFSLVEQYKPATIDIINKKITILVKKGSDITKLRPTILTDIGVLSPLSDIELDFTNPRTYTISSNCIDYQWLVEVLTDNTIKIDLCSEETTTITGLTNNDPNSFFQWEIKDGGNNWIIAPGISNTANYNFNKQVNNGNVNQVFQFRRKTTLNANDVYDTEAEITIHPLTTNNIISTPITKFCNGKASITIDGTTPTGATNVTSTFIWQRSLDGIVWTNINNTNTKDLTTPEFTETLFFRRITQSEICNAYSNTIKAEINPLPTIANAGIDQSLCNTTTLQLDANSIIGNETGSWSVVSPTTFNPFTPLNINDPKAIINNIPENEEVILKWTITQNDCLTASSAQVKIFNYGIPIFLMPTNFTINEGQTLVIPATSTPNPNTTYTYQWTPILYLDDPTKLAPNASPLETSIYHLNISYGSCLLEKEIKIIVNKAIKLDVCPSTPITLVGAVDNDALSVYQWQKLIAGVWTDIPNANKFDLSITTPENFTNAVYQVEYRRVVINSPYYDSRYLLSISTRTDNNIIKTNETVYCATSIDNLLIEGSTPTGANNTTITFAWQQSDDGNTWTNIANTTKDLSIANLTKTTYFKRITHADACETESNVLKVQINLPATIAYAGESIPYCGATTITLKANAVNVNEIGTWKVISPAGYNPFDTQSIHNPKATILNLPLNQLIELQWTIENHNCNTSTTSEVSFISFEDIIINAPKALTIDLGKKINLGVTANLSSKVNYVIEWLPSIGLDQSNILSPNAAPTDNTIYNLKISYGDNCFNSSSIKVIVLKNIEIPNSFSPNGDGINDSWEIKNLANYPGSKVFVYNRYGSTIFESNSYAISWDGKHKGKTVPTGTFYYVIILKDGKNSIYKGSITILN